MKLHISRVHYQITVWLNATFPSPERMDPKTCGWEPDVYCNQLEPKLLLLEPVPTFVRSCCNALAKPVPQEDANADKTILHAFHRVAVHQLHVAIHRMLLKTLTQKMIEEES